MPLTITNIKRVGSDTLESVTVEDGLIKGWNLPESDLPGHDVLDGKGGTVAPALAKLHAHPR